jgi:hypothetical protein
MHTAVECTLQQGVFSKTKDDHGVKVQSENPRRKGMQVDLQVTEAQAKELAVLFNQTTSRSSIPEGTTIEIVRPMAAIFGADSEKWTVRLKTGLATAAQIATLVTFLMTHTSLTHLTAPAAQTQQVQCEVTLIRGQTTMHAQFPCSSDSAELVKGITDFMAANGQPDKVHVKLFPSHHKKQQ